MENLKAWIRGLGVVIMCIGFMCMPFYALSNPKMQTSLWPFVAAFGSFVKIGLSISVAGLILMVASFFIRER